MRTLIKKYRGKALRNFEPAAGRSVHRRAYERYTTIVCNIMPSEKTRTAKAAVRATNLDK